MGALAHALKSPRVHERFEHFNGEAAIGSLGKVMRGHYAYEPFGRFWTDALTRPVRDDFWASRDMTTVADQIDIPVYLGCDWDNVPLHLPGTFRLWDKLRSNPNVQMGLLGPGGMTWPWESLHVEALAWFDHWLKGIDTGITEGPPIRYWLAGANEFRAAQTWPPEGVTQRAWSLSASGILNEDDGLSGSRTLEYQPATAVIPKGAPPQQSPAWLTWQSEVLPAALTMTGTPILELDATVSALNAHWYVTLFDVDPTGLTTPITAGWQRDNSRVITPGNDPVHTPISLVPNARQFLAGHRIQITLASDDHHEQAPAMLGFTHAPPGEASVNEVFATTRLVLPILPDRVDL